MFRHKDIVCRRAVELVTDYLEDQLSASDRRRFEKHLDGCPHCREYLAQMRTTIDALGRIEPESLSPETREQLVDLYRQWQAS